LLIILASLLLSEFVGARSSSASSYGLAYEGAFVYSLDGNGNRTLESIAFDEGRILKSGSSFVADYHIKDHLGSVRAVVRNGNIIEEDDYYPYGAKMAKPGLISQTSPVPNRYLFSSKEDQTVAFGSYGLDFGARDYAHDGLTWFEPDPLASKYYHLSPYIYCAGNPILYIDIMGLTTYKTRKEEVKIDDTYDETIEVSARQMEKLNEAWACCDTSKYVRMRNSVMAKNGYLDANGNPTLSAAFCISYPTRAEWMADHDVSAASNISFFGASFDISANLSYNEMFGFWRDKAGVFRKMSFNGNQYTGGRLKYAKNLSQQCKHLSKNLYWIGVSNSIVTYVNSTDSRSKVTAITDLAVSLLSAVPYAGPAISLFWAYYGEYWFDTHLAYDWTYDWPEE